VATPSWCGSWTGWQFTAAVSVAIYDTVLADDGAGDWPAWALHYEAGLAAYRDRRWDEAERHFAAAAAERAGGDAPSQLFIERCRASIAAPPGADWTPVAVRWRIARLPMHQLPARGRISLGP
jgi:hypothetical protein